MAVAASPDGRSLAIDLQGSIWILPAAGGTARRITDEFNDARQPAWSPDGRTIAFQGYRDGGYDIWGIAPDGSHQRQLTWGPYDDREPAWSHDGSRMAFSSDRGGSSNYDIWVLDTRSGQLQQVTTAASDDFMPTWSPDDREIAFVSSTGAAQGLHAIGVPGGIVRRVSAEGLRIDAPSWGPGGTIVYQAQSAGTSRLELDGRPITGSENAAPFRAAWVSPSEIVYVSDGLIRRRRLTGGEATTIPFSAALQVTRASYKRTVRDVDSRAHRQALGILTPTISPDGRQIAFIALGDLWLMPASGGRPVNLTSDRFLDAEPAWSPDGTQLAWSTDRGGDLLDIWIRDMRSGSVRRLTHRKTSAMGAAWSPDGTRIAFLDVDAVWRAASVAVVDVATGGVTTIHASMFGPGAPTWSPDGKRVAFAALSRYSTRFREGTNQVLTIPSTGGEEQWFTPVNHLSIDSRIGAGPAWSPDGTRMALVYEGYLTVLPVSPSGEPQGPPRRVSREMAHQPTWTADGKHVLYQFNRHLRLLDTESGELRDIPVDLPYAPSIPSGRIVVHAGRLVDGVATAARDNMDIVVVGNRIRSVTPHSAATHRTGTVVDGSNLTAMPGLIEFHTHLQKDLGEAHARAYLAFGITTVRSPGSSPYEAVEDREAVDAGVRVGPRLFVTGYLMEWQRVYYKMAVAISSPHHLNLELERGKALKFDLFKSYVRMPDLQQKHIVDFGHAMGIPVASHEVYPSALSGQDGTEHLTGTSRRGYSPKVTTLQMSYADVSATFGAANMSLTPTLALGGGGIRQILAKEPTFKDDARFALYPPWLTGGMAGGGAGPPGARPGASSDINGQYAMIMNAQKAGARIVAGTDTPNAFSLHGELLTYVQAGMTPYEALRTATVNPAEALMLDAGSIAAGKLADIVLVEGNPLEDIGNAKRVKQVIANGRRFTLEELVKGVGAPHSVQPPDSSSR